MKSTSVSTKIITILLLLAVIGYFAVQGYNYFVSPETTTLVYRYHSEQSIALRGYVVRDEQVVDCNETLIELKHAEGERVGQGDTIIMESCEYCNSFLRGSQARGPLRSPGWSRGRRRCGSQNRSLLSFPRCGRWQRKCPWTADA